MQCFRDSKQIALEKSNESSTRKERELLERKNIPGEVIEYYMEQKARRFSLRDAAMEFYRRHGGYTEEMINKYTTEYMGKINTDSTPMTIDDLVARDIATSSKGKKTSLALHLEPNGQKNGNKGFRGHG